MSKDKSVRTEKLKNVLKEKTKSLLGPVLILLLIVIGILIIAFWKEEETPEEIVKVNTYEGNSSDIVLENENLKMVMDPETTQFTVTKKSTGAIWYSTDWTGSPVSRSQIEKQLHCEAFLDMSRE